MKMENSMTKKGFRLGSVRKEYVVPVISFLAVFLLFLIATKGAFLAPTSLVNIANVAFPTMIASLGAVFIYSHGGIDFSLGPVQGLSMMVIALVLNNSMDRIVLALVLGMLTSLVCGVLLASLRVYLRLPSLIASLCVQSIATGILQAITMAGSVTLPVGMVVLDQTAIKIGMLLVMVVMTVIVFEYTKIGKGNKAMGANETSCALMGINNNHMIFFAHLLTNFAVGVSAIFYSAQISQIVATSGFGLEMDVMVAAVIGGMSLKGGTRSTIVNILVGSVIVSMMSTGFAMWGINPNVTMGIKGFVFLLILYVTRDRNKNAVIE